MLDTNVIVTAMRNQEFAETLDRWQRQNALRLHQHAVVVAELLNGAADEVIWRRWYERWVEPAENIGRVLVPGYAAWLRASRIVSRLIATGKLARSGGKASFFNDCLLAATCQEFDHALVTFNTADFDLIASVEPTVRYCSPLP